MKSKKNYEGIDHMLEARKYIIENYKSYKDKNILLLKVFYSTAWRYFIIYAMGLFLFFLVIGTSKSNFDDFLMFTYISLLFCVIACISMFAGYYNNIHNFGHIIMAISRAFSMSILGIIYMYPMIYTAELLDLSNLFYIMFSVFMLPFSIYYVVRARRIVKKNFSDLYSIIDGKIFFDYLQYIKMQKFQSDPPYIYFRFAFFLLYLAAFNGLFAKSFHSNMYYAYGTCILSFIVIFLMSQFYIWALYMLFVVHPRVAKKFNQPILSDQWGFFALDAALAGKTVDQNPVQRPIEYEEVFPKTRI